MNIEKAVVFSLFWSTFCFVLDQLGYTLTGVVLYLSQYGIFFLGHKMKKAERQVITITKGSVTLVVLPKYHRMWYIYSIAGGIFASPDGHGGGRITTVDWVYNSIHWEPLLQHEMGHLVYDQDLAKKSGLVVEEERELRADRHAATMTSSGAIISALHFLVKSNPFCWTPFTMRQLKRRVDYLRLFE